MPQVREDHLDPALHDQVLAQAHGVNIKVLKELSELRCQHSEAADAFRGTTTRKLWSRNRMLYANAQRTFSLGLFVACYTNALLRSLSSPQACIDLRTQGRGLRARLQRLPLKQSAFGPWARHIS